MARERALANLPRGFARAFDIVQFEERFAARGDELALKFPQAALELLVDEAFVRARLEMHRSDLHRRS